MSTPPNPSSQAIGYMPLVGPSPIKYTLKVRYVTTEYLTSARNTDYTEYLKKNLMAPFCFLTLMLGLGAGYLVGKIMMFFQ